MTPTMRLMRHYLLSPATVALAGAALSGCGSMAGVGGSADYACKAPDGVQCDSVSGTYANALQNNLPGQRPARPPVAPNGNAPAPSGSKSVPGAARALARSAVMPTSLRSEGRIQRLWIKPWADSDGALHDQSYVYLQTDPGRWLVDHAQRQIRDAYSPVRPPRTAAAPAGAPAAPKPPLASNTSRPASPVADDEQ